MLKLYGGDKGKPTKIVVTQGAKIKGGKTVVTLHGLGGCYWMKGQESKSIRHELAASEGTEDSDATDEEDEEKELEVEEPEGSAAATGPRPRPALHETRQGRLHKGGSIPRC